jgi:hypothetical protein
MRYPEAPCRLDPLIKESNHMRTVLHRIWALSALACLTLLPAGVRAEPNHGDNARDGRVTQVVVLFLDGGHREQYTPQNAPTISALAAQGIDYVNAQTGFPSDSVPGIVNPFTGNNVTDTGLPYDTFYDRAYGQVIALKEAPSLPPGVGFRDLIHEPTVFNAASAAGLTSAFIAKHTSYAVLSGPTSAGDGVTTLITPEIKVKCPNSLDYKCQEQYDHNNMTALLGLLTGPNPPAIAGQYLLAPSAAQKAGGIGSSANADAVKFEDAEVARLVQTLKDNGTWDHTMLIITADHGQSPVNSNPYPNCTPNMPSATVPCPFIPPSALQGILNAQGIPVVQITPDDVALIWLKDPSQTAAAVAAFSTPAAMDALAIDRILTHDDLVNLGAAPANRTPDLVLLPKAGFDYDKITQKALASHGGLKPDDQAVPLIVSGGAVQGHGLRNESVQSTQIATTIARVLGLSFPSASAPILPGVQGTIH